MDLHICLAMSSATTALVNKPQYIAVGTVLSLDGGKFYNISVYAISKSDNTTGRSHPTTRMFTMGKGFFRQLVAVEWEIYSQ